MGNIKLFKILLGQQKMFIRVVEKNTCASIGEGISDRS
jgi:hypothetical protein